MPHIVCSKLVCQYTYVLRDIINLPAFHAEREIILQQLKSMTSDVSFAIRTTATRFLEELNTEEGQNPQENGIIVIPTGAKDPILELGLQPVVTDVSDASINHDA
jgi:hypothetical protein